MFTKFAKTILVTGIYVVMRLPLWLVSILGDKNSTKVRSSS